MLNKVAKALLISTSTSPLFLVSAIAKLADGGDLWNVVLLLGVSLLLAAGGIQMVERAKYSLQASVIDIKKAKSSDKEILAFFLAYASPIFLSKIVLFSFADMATFGATIAFVLLGTNTLNVNPILGLYGYNYYEVDSSDGISYLLLSKRKIYNIKEIKVVVQLTEYAILDWGS